MAEMFRVPMRVLFPSGVLADLGSQVASLNTSQTNELSNFFNGLQLGDMSHFTTHLDDNVYLSNVAGISVVFKVEDGEILIVSVSKIE